MIKAGTTAEDRQVCPSKKPNKYHDRHKHKPRTHKDQCGVQVSILFLHKIMVILLASHWNLLYFNVGLHEIPRRFRRRDSNSLSIAPFMLEKPNMVNIRLDAKGVVV